MKDQFIPYHLALQLKQLGFNKQCMAAYFHPNLEEIKYPNIFKTDDSLNMGELFCTAPLWQQAFDYFREQHKLLSSISQPFNQEYCFEIKNLKYVKKEGELSSMQSKVFTLYSDAKNKCLERLIQEIQSNLPF